MRILLAPSETKTPGSDDRALDLKELLFPQLEDARTKMLDALISVSGAPDALEQLGVGARVAEAVYANLNLREAKTAPAYGVYTGVAFDAARLWELVDTAGTRAIDAMRHLYIMSGLFGVVRATDSIPAYRLSMGTLLPGIGNNGTFWKKYLHTVLSDDTAGQLVIDCRSGAYQKPWLSSSDAFVVSTRILRDEGDSLKVVSHHAKHWRGLITRACLEYLLSDKNCGLADIKHPDTLAEICAGIAGANSVELETIKGGMRLTLITR